MGFLSILLLTGFYFWIHDPLYFFLTSREAESFVQKGHLDKALQLYQNLHKVHPEDAFVAKKLGDILTMKESYTEAAKHYEKSLHITKDPVLSSDIHHNLGNVLFKIGSFNEAAQQYKKSLRLHSAEETKWNLELSLRNPSTTQTQEKKDSSSSPTNDQQSLQKPKISKQEAESILQSIGEKKYPKIRSNLPLESGLYLDKNW